MTSYSGALRRATITVTGLMRPVGHIEIDALRECQFADEDRELSSVSLPRWTLTRSHNMKIDATLRA